MIKFLQIIYNWIAGLKKYHAMHVFTVLPGLCTISVYLFVLYSNIFYGYNTDENEFFFMLCAIPISVISIICTTLAICILIIISMISRITKNKIYIKSKFLLHNKFYNITFWVGLLMNILLFLTFSTQLFSNFIIFNLPIYLAHKLLMNISQYFIKFFF